MEILILIAIPTLLVWCLVFFDQQLKTKANLIPTIGLLVVVAGSVFGYSFFHLSGGPIPITLDRVLLVGLLAVFGLMWFRGSERLRPLNKADVLILALVAILTWSMLRHDWRFRDNMPASRLLFFYFVPLALYLVVRSARLNVSDLKWISFLLGGLGVYLALTAIAETMNLSGLVFPRFIMSTAETEFLGRGRGPFLNPVSNGIFMVTCLCSIWMWWPHVGRRFKFVLMLLTVVMCAGIFCTLTRSIWLSLLASAALVIWYPASRQTKGALIILATVLAVITFPIVGEKIFSFKRDKEVSQAEMEQSAHLRPMFAIVALNMFKDRPIFGCGFGQYAREKYPYLQDPYSGKPLSSTKHFMQHNVFLAYLTETGLVGLLMLSFMILQMTVISWSVWRNEELELWSRLFGMLMLVVLINFFINGMFHDVSIIPMQNTLLLFMFAVVNNIYSAQHAFQFAPLQKLSPDSLPAIVRPRSLLIQ